MNDNNKPGRGARYLWAGLFAGSLLAAGPAVAQDKVIVAHAAGINGQAVEMLLQEFTAETGMPVQGITFSDTDYGAKMQLVARAGNPAFDVALGLALDVYALTKPAKIYGPIDTSGWAPATLAAMRDAKLITEDYAVSQDTAALLVYSAKLTAGPSTWADFFDKTKFPGNRGMASGGLGVPINFEYAMIGSGVAPAKVNPIDYDAALKELSKLGGGLVLWDNAPKGIQDVVNGDTVMTWSYAPAALSAIKAGQAIKIAAPPRHGRGAADRGRDGQGTGRHQGGQRLPCLVVQAGDAGEVFGVHQLRHRRAVQGRAEQDSQGHVALHAVFRPEPGELPPARLRVL